MQIFNSCQTIPASSFWQLAQRYQQGRREGRAEETIVGV